MMLTLALGDAMQSVVERVRRSTVEIRTRRARESGSGIIWDSAGLVVTNAHVARHRNLTISLADGRDVDGEVVAHDPTRDLAALKLEASGLPSAEIGDSDTLRPGEFVVAVGSPLGVTGAATVGVVHRAAAPGPFGRRWIEADVRLAPGNSGGPLSDAGGRVVGVNTMIASGLALAVPSKTVVRFLSGTRTPRLGVVVEPALVVSERTKAAALLVTDVAPQSAAAEAGLAHGDAIIGIDGRPLGAPQDLAGVLVDWDVAEPLRLELVRGGRRLVRDVRLSRA
jgi:serine protease Do